MMNFVQKYLVLFLDGSMARMVVYIYGGSCIAGQPTAYVLRDKRLVWVKPGESVDFVEQSDT